MAPWGNKNKDLTEQLELLRQEINALKAKDAEQKMEEASRQLAEQADTLANKEKALREQEEALRKKEEQLKIKEEQLRERESVPHEDAITLPNEREENAPTLVTPVSETEKAMSTLTQIKTLLEDMAYKDKLIKELHEELHKNSLAMQAEQAKPFLKNIIKIHERIAKTYWHFTKEGTEEQAELFTQLLKNTESNMLMIQDMLEDEYDLLYTEPSAGSPYVPKEHQALRSLPTNDPSKAGTIAECIYGGFKGITSGKILKPAIVAVYKLDESIR